MNFDSKDLVKWGVLGWMYLAAIIIYFLLVDDQAVKLFLSTTKEMSIIVSVIALFIAAGIIIGHLIDQFGHCFGFVIWINRKKIYKNKSELEFKFIKAHNGAEIQRIYRYRTANIEAYRSVWFSLFLSFLTLVILSLAYEFSVEIGIFMLIVLGFNWIVLTNWFYYQKNFEYFMKKIKTDG